MIDVRVGWRAYRSDELLMHVEHNIPLEIGGECGGNLSDVEATVDVEEELIVAVELGHHKGREGVEARELIDSGLLRVRTRVTGDG